MVTVLLHIAAGIAFSAVLLGALGVIVAQLESHRHLIVATLVGEFRPAGPRPWPARVRTMVRPSPLAASVPQRSCARA